MAGFRTRSGVASAPLPPLAEGAEAALLYVRFRAAAEPGLKGALRSFPAHCLGSRCPSKVWSLGYRTRVYTQDSGPLW